jgi:hypothetical protein
MMPFPTTLNKLEISHDTLLRSLAISSEPFISLIQVLVSSKTDTNTRHQKSNIFRNTL